MGTLTDDEFKTLLSKASTESAALTGGDGLKPGIIQSSSAAAGSASSTSQPVNWTLHRRDINILSAAFLLVFLAFGAIQNLESSINKDQGLGQVSLGVLYSCLTVFSLGAPAVVQLVGPKKSMLYGLSGYWLYGAANLWPSWWTLVPAAVYLGFCAAILWVAQGTYLTAAAKAHAGELSLSEEAVIGSFNGTFWGFFASHQVLGNLVALLICLALENGSTDTSHLSRSTQQVLFGALLVSMTLGTILAFFMREQRPRKEGSGEAPVGLPDPDLAGASVALLWDRQMLLLLPILLYSGLQQAFIWAAFTESVVRPALGVAWVPGVMALYGVADALASAAAGRLSTGVGSIAGIVGAGATCQALVLLGLLLNPSLGRGRGLCAAAILWGIGDAALNTQLSSLLPILNPQQTVAAFAQWKVWQSGASAAAFFAGPHTGLVPKLLTLLLTLVASLSAFLKVTLQRGPAPVHLGPL